MKERRILPSSLKKYEKYIKEPTFLLTEPVHIEEDILDNSVKTQQAQVLTMESVRIDFPLKPYPAQLQMMSKIIHALNNSENALLESPTGSGKSLALLCAALAWRENERKKLEQGSEEQSEVTIGKRERPPAPEDWAKRFKCEETEGSCLPETEYDPPPPKISKPSNYLINKKLPRIFVGSRTHRQLTQLISELKRNTQYTPRITVLGSRDQLCIHPRVSKTSNKNEECATLLDKQGCDYAPNTAKILKNPMLRTTHRVWDIEDMVTLGKKVQGCPYYAARKLYESAEVIFCPYNYILDPVIRKLLDINLKESIVILDEAHNMEDAARSAGSFEIDDKTLNLVKIELTSIIKGGFKIETYRVINAYRVIECLFDSLWGFINSPNNTYETSDFNRRINIWSGSKMIRKLQELNITDDVFTNELIPAYKIVSNHAEMIRKEKENNVINNELETGDSQVKIYRRECLSNNSLMIVRSIFMVFRFLFRNDRNYVDDYRMALMKRIEMEGNGNKKRKPNPDSVWQYKLGFWCLNPGVIFQDMCASTKSVILTSGTLSPMDTFASELETSFPGKLEANHVIEPSQVWVSCIPVGPKGSSLRGVYSNIEGTEYQDDVGEALCEIAETVPFGLLCFVPSYKVLDNLMARWRKTGVSDRLKNKKLVLREPKGSDKRKFEREIHQFYKHIEDAVSCPDEEGQDGAIFFAVYRGKISEGIDFTNEYCRAVVALGIPYPGIKDMEVKLKKEYNDMKRKNMHDNNILSGSDWYSIQAFRAINQALGRCIRHKNDWGAIILLEDRFQEEKNLKGLSKWLRNRVQVNNSFHEGISSLQKFVQTRLAIDKEAAALLAENAKKDQQVALPSQSANTTQETTIIKDEEVENTVPPLSQNFSEDTSLDGIIAETLNSIIETEKRLESNYLAYKNASRREATFPDFTPVVPSAACAITETVSQLIVNHITNPIRDSIVSPITNPISNPITNPIVNPTANPIVNPITCPISKPVTGLPFITQNDNISTTKEESDTQDNTIQALKEKTDTRGKHLHTLEEKIDTQDSDYHTLEEEDITQITTKLIPKIENKMDSISIADNQGFSGITSTIDVQHTTLSAPSKENRNHYESYTSKGNTIYKEQNSQSPKNSKKSFKDLDDVFKDIENDTNDDAYDEIYDDMDYGMDNDLNDDMNAIFKDMGDGMDDDLNDDMDAIFKDMYLQESHIPTAHSSSNSFQHKGNNVYPVLCKDCQCTLMIGNINFLKISNDPLLNCMVSLTKKGDLIVEVENPSSWETFGLCMDASQLPNETQVYMNRVDQLFYQKINCNCGKLCGIIVCGAMVIEKQIHVGKVLLLNSAIVTQKEKAQVGSVDIEDDDELWGDISPSEVHQMVISSQMLQ